MGVASEAVDREERSLSVVAWIVMVVVYLALVQGLQHLMTSGLDADYGEFPDTETLLRGLVLPVGVSVAFVWGAVALLRWWHPVVHDDRPTRRWVWVAPIMMIVTIAAGTNYGGLSDRGFAYTLTFLVGGLCVGAAEEGMFRGIGIVTLRKSGLTEAKVALWSCLVFGAAHATNIFSEGPSALLQVVVTIIAGYFFYLTRRVSKGILLPILIHGLWDFGLLSGALDDDPYAGMVLFILMDVILAIIVLTRRHKVEPETAPAT